jgi:hypothetical protein
VDLGGASQLTRRGLEWGELMGGVEGRNASSGLPGGSAVTAACSSGEAAEETESF